MKVVSILLLLCVVFVGCGPKSNEEIARDLITAKMKATLADFSAYEPLNYGQLGSASLPYEETETYKTNSAKLKEYRDSVAMLEQMVAENKAVAESKEKLTVLQDSISAVGSRNSETKQSYVPTKLFKMSHAYNLKDKLGVDKKTEDEFYFNEALTEVVKSKNVY
ncbi:MAG: hypothetical protein ABJB11_07610 [Ferruginibacter sp.]